VIRDIRAILGETEILSYLSVPLRHWHLRLHDEQNHSRITSSCRLNSGPFQAFGTCHTSKAEQNNHWDLYCVQVLWMQRSEPSYAIKISDDCLWNATESK
jgi:hypothetical protein